MSSGRHAKHPERIGRYRLVRELGRGSYGVVYLAERDEDGQRFAIKVLTDRAVESEEAMARFKLEARVASKIDDPGVVAIHETGRIGRNPYYVMEYCEGPTLRDRRKAEGPFEPREAARIVARLARIIASAHEMGVIHRDLKPANVILAGSDGGDPRVTDFGLAQDRTHHQRLTKTGDVVGTPYYMASEQIQGQDVDARVDVYALGVILYELLAGERPYQAPTLVEVAKLVNEGAAVPLEQRRPELPAELIQIQRRAMAVDRDERYMDAAALAGDLESYLRGSIEAAGAPGGRKPLLLGAVVALVVLVVSLAVAIPWSQRRAAREEARALLAQAAERPQEAIELLKRAAALAPDDPELAQAIAAAQQEQAEAGWVRRLRGRVEAQGSAAEVRALLRDAPEAEAVRAARDALVPGALEQGRFEVAEALAEGNASLVAEVHTARAERTGARQLKQARELLAVDATSSDARGLLESARGRLGPGKVRDEVEAELAAIEALRALARIPRLLRRPDPWGQVDKLLAEHGASANPRVRDQVALWRLREHRLRGRYEEAIQAAAPLVERKDAVGYEARWQRAMAHTRLMNYAESEPELRRLAAEDAGSWGLAAKALIEFTYDRKLNEAVTSAASAVRADPQNVEARLTHAFALMNANRDAESEQVVQRVLRAFPDHPRAHLGRAFLAQRRRRFDDALEAYGRVIALTEPGMPLACQQRGVVYRHLRRPELALADLTTALKRVPTLVKALLVRAAIYESMQRRDEAEADLRAAAKADLSSFEQLLSTQVGPHLIKRVLTLLLDDPLLTAKVPQPPPLRYAPGKLGEAQKLARARKPHAQVLQALEAAEAAAPDDAARAAVRLERADYLWRRGRYEEAVAQAQQLAKLPGRTGYQARYIIGFSRIWQLRYQEGLAELKKLKDEDPEGPVGNNAGAAWLSYSGRNPEGEVLARKAIALDPTWVDPYLSLSFCLNDQAKRLTALATITRILPSAPDHPRAHMARGMILTNLRQRGDAAEALKTVIALTEPQPALRPLAFHTRNSYNVGDWKTTIWAASRYLKRVPNDTSAVRFMRGLAYLRTKDHPNALLDLREYGRRNPQAFQQVYRRLAPRDQQAIRRLLQQPGSR